MTRDFQSPNRTLRANAVKVDPLHDRIYMIMGGGVFAGYRYSSFASQIGSPLQTSAHGEKYLPFEMSVNPEATGSGWTTFWMDGQERLYDFDFDNRGYIYLAYSFWGFGIVDLKGTLVSQVTSGAIGPYLTFTFASGGNQYLLVSDQNSGSEIYDVTDPSTPVKVKSLALVVKAYAKDATSDHIAIIDADRTKVKIYTPSDLLNDTAPVAIDHNTTYMAASATPFQFLLLSSDGTRFFAAQQAVSTTLSNTAYEIVSIITPGESGYTSTELAPLSNHIGQSLIFGSGYLVYTAVDFQSPHSPWGDWYRFDGPSTTMLSTTTYLRSNATLYNGLQYVVPFCTDAGSYAIFAAQSIGDVYHIAPGAWPCAPGAPTNVIATGGEASATISFDPPASDGGSPIQSYLVHADPGDIRATGMASPITVTGLANATTYTFSVVATNAAGATAAAPSNPITTFGAPAYVNAVANGQTSVDVSWQSVSAAQYDVLRGTTMANLAHYTFVNDATLHDTNVQPDTTYIYAVEAINAADVHSDRSPLDIATTFDFTPVASGMPVAAAPMIQLKDAVNAVRTAAGKDPIDFTAAVAAGSPIAASHLNDLQSALNEARQTLTLSAFPFSDSTNLPLSAVYLAQIRNATN